jgi:hypothetical protein
MQVMVNKNIPVYVNAGGFKQKYVQDIAEDIGGMILKAFRAGNNNSMDDTVTVGLQSYYCRSNRTSNA